jgi:hypothetical protein
MAETKIVKLKYNNIKAKLNNRGMRKVISKSNKGKVQPKNYKKLSLQTVLPSLSKDFDKRMEAVLSIPPERAKELRDK